MDLSVIIILVILAGPIFFIWKWVFKKFVKIEKLSEIATWVVTIIAVPLIYIGIINLWFYSMSYYPKQKFIKEKWFSDKEKRYELSQDLIKSQKLIGKTKAQVYQLLGDEGNSDSSDYWTYYLGFRPAFANIDVDLLDIEFKNGVVINVSQHET
jgi:hypothetical protein